METTPVKSRLKKTRSAPKPVRARKAGLPLNTMAMLTAIWMMMLSGLTFPYWHLLPDKITANSRPDVSKLPTDKAHIANWQDQLRTRLKQVLQIDEHQDPVQSRVLEDKVVRTLMYDGNFLRCRRQTIEFTSEAGTPVVAYLLLPENLKQGEKLPCVICLPGHGAGVDHSVGIDSDGTLMQMWDKTPRDFALFFAYRGYAVLAMEQAGIGRRSQISLKGPVLEKAECLLSDAKLRYKGKTSLGERVKDVKAAVDLLVKEPAIDPARLAVMGISAGGTTALYSAALDQRLKCAIVVSALSTYNDSIFRQVQCMCNYVPGLPSVCDPAQVAALIAPRALFVESGLTDDRFPARSAKTVWQEVHSLYERMGAQKNIGLDVCNHGHRCFFGKQAIKFLNKAI